MEENAESRDDCRSPLWAELQEKAKGDPELAVGFDQAPRFP
jgi:hypothetical protein